MMNNPHPTTTENHELIAHFLSFNEQNFVRLTRQLYRQVTNNMNARLDICGYHDLRARHLSIFDHLDENGTNINTLAQRAGITKQAMSKLVQEAKAAGYVCVETDKRDTRVSNVYFNAKGLKFLKNLQSEINKIRGVISETDYVSKEDLTSTISTLSKILKYFEASDVLLDLENRKN